MRTAFVVYNRMTMLDFVGVYDPLTRLRSMGFRSDFEWKICAPTATATDDRGLAVQADSVGEPLNAFDMVIVAGGFVARELQHDAAFIAWLQTASGANVKASVCTGSLLLGAAGFLTGRPATSHPSAFEELAQYCGSVLDDRVVDAGDVVTARGVTAGIDLGLHLVARIAGVDVQEKIAKQMDYPHVWKK
jgi:cyclohexyl-isocyanide hydratase